MYDRIIFYALNIGITAYFWRYVFSFQYIFDMLYFFVSYTFVSFFTACFVWCFLFATEHGQILDFINDFRVQLAQRKNRFSFIAKWLGGCASCTAVFFGIFAAVFAAYINFQLAPSICILYAFVIPFATPIFLNLIQKNT